MPDADSEVALVQRAVAGDSDALAQLLEQHGPAVRSRLQGKIDRRWQSLVSEDDVMQETYAEAFLGIARFVPRGQGSFLSWLYMLARNNLLDAVRELQTAKKGGDRVRFQAPATEDSCVDLLQNIGGSITSPSSAFARKEAHERLEDALRRLPRAYAQVVRLYDLEGGSAEEVAEQLGCSPGAVYMRRARAHAQLQEILESLSGM
ncbi:MAG: sigma-70 family RNA polymerase sigma factor [Planctomycetes bacterium]|nr:sigma-70 family RNA polymerase sigma factor [Planctomycetota bacterium]